MKSRITIEVDFDNSNTPVIQIIRAGSQDVRDSLVGNFVDSLQHGTQLLKIEYKGEAGIDPETDRIIQRWVITPVTK